MSEERSNEIDQRSDQLKADLASIETVFAELNARRESLLQEMRAGFAMIMKRFDDHAERRRWPFGDAEDFLRLSVEERRSLLRNWLPTSR